jgi:nucleotide-binding universal stress UspA family protein
MHILCPVDFSSTSERALDYAMALARRLDARVTLLHTYNLPSVLMPDGVLLPNAEALTTVSADHQQMLDRLAETRAGRLVPLTTKLRLGSPAQEVLAAIREETPDLVVMGTHGRTGLQHVLLGSIAERVVRASTVPVMTIREPHAGDAHAQVLTVEMKRIACAVDFSDASAKALSYAATLARRLGAELLLVHVCATLAYAMASESYTVRPDLLIELKAHLKGELEALAAAQARPGLKVTSQLIEGVPYKAIHEAAQQSHADMIVVGTHGRTGFEHLLLGSVAERLVRTSSLPVVTVHPQG